MGEGAHLAGDGGQHAVGAGAGDAEAGVQGRDEGGRAGRVDPQQTAAAAGDDGVSGEDFTAVGHGLQPSDLRAGLARPRDTATPGVHQVTRGGWDRRDRSVTSGDGAASRARHHPELGRVGQALGVREHAHRVTEGAGPLERERSR